MSPLSGPVLGGAALMASPALYAGLWEGSMAIDVALTRYLIAVGLCWALLSLLVEWALPSGPTTVSTEQQAGEAAAEGATDRERPTSGT